MDENALRTIALIFLILAGLSLAVALLLIALTYYQLRNLRLPPGLGFVATLRRVPLTLVIALDLLDFALDVFAAPIAWILLGRLNLQGLRAVTVVESLIPFTQAIPTLTLAWLAVRLFDLGEDDPRMQWLEGQARSVPRPRL